MPCPHLFFNFFPKSSLNLCLVLLTYLYYFVTFIKCIKTFSFYISTQFHHKIKHWKFAQIDSNFYTTLQIVSEFKFFFQFQDSKKLTTDYFLRFIRNNYPLYAMGLLHVNHFLLHQISSYCFLLTKVLIFFSSRRYWL